MADYISPHWTSSALLVIDKQGDFAEGGISPVPGTVAVVPGVGRLATGYRQAGLPVVHIVRLYPPGGSDTLGRQAAMPSAASRVGAEG